MDTENLIEMRKGDETIKVSPLVVEDHQRLGWKVSESVEKPKPAQSKASEGSGVKPGK